MPETIYKQCKLIKRNIYYVTWLPEEFAIKGQFLKIKERDVWEDGWNVKYVYPTQKTERQLKAHDRYYKPTLASPGNPLLPSKRYESVSR